MSRLPPKKELEYFMKSLAKIYRVLPEHRFSTSREFRFDYAIPDLKIAVEYDGVTTKSGEHSGRHTGITGFSVDHEKFNLASIDGWIILRFTKMHFSAKARKALNITDPWKQIQNAIGERLRGS